MYTQLWHLDMDIHIHMGEKERETERDRERDIYLGMDETHVLLTN